MGNRTSIQFVKNYGEKIEDRSVILYDHYGGESMPSHARDFVKKFVKKYPTDERCNGPAERHEPDIIMVEFLIWYAQNIKKKEPYDDLRLHDHDCVMGGNDNGHFLIDTETGMIAEHYD